LRRHGGVRSDFERKPALHLMPNALATMNGSFENGVFDMMPNGNAGKENYSRKNFIQARPVSGNPLALPQARPMKIRPK